jgi:DNA-binding transcriptional LysR family regulator
MSKLAGMAWLPHWLITDELASGELVQVLPQWKAKEVPLNVVYAGQRVLPARVSAFIEFALGRLGAVPISEPKTVKTL